jgi:hypothetical protein
MQFLKVKGEMVYGISREEAESRLLALNKIYVERSVIPTPGIRRLSSPIRIGIGSPICVEVVRRPYVDELEAPGCEVLVDKITLHLKRWTVVFRGGSGSHDMCVHSDGDEVAFSEAIKITTGLRVVDFGCYEVEVVVFAEGEDGGGARKGQS